MCVLFVLCLVRACVQAIIAYHCPHIRVIVADISVRQIEKWNSSNLPIYEPGLDEVVLKCRGKNLFFTSDVDAAIRASEMIFVSVNTPTKTHGVGAGRAANLKNWEVSQKKETGSARLHNGCHAAAAEQVNSPLYVCSCLFFSPACRPQHQQGC